MKDEEEQQQLERQIGTAQKKQEKKIFGGQLIAVMR